MATRWRGILKRFHPEAIPWPASLLYNAISGTEIFLQHYRMVARDLSRYGVRNGSSISAPVRGDCFSK